MQMRALVLSKLILIILVLSLAIVIILIVFFLSVIIPVAGTGCCGFANMGVVTHGLCIGAEVVQAVGTDEAKVVEHSLQMIHYHSLILTLFAAPGAEGQATLSLQGLGGMDALEAMIFGDFVNKTIWKKWMSLEKPLPPS